MQHVRRHYRVLGVSQNTLERAFGGSFQSGVDGFGGSGLRQNRDKIDDRDVGGGDAHGVTIQFPLQLRHYQADGFGGAGGGGNHVDRGSAGAAQILVREIQHVLVVGVTMDGGHRTL